MTQVYKDIIRLTIDLKTGVKEVIAPIKQADNLSRVLRCQLVNNGKPVSLKGSQLMLYVIKADFKQCVINGVINESKTGIVDFELTEQSLILPEEIQCEIVKIDEGDVLLSFPIFKIGIDGALYDNELVESTNEFSALTALISNVASWENRFVEDVKEINSALKNKINYNEGGVITTSMLSQEVKEAMTGGSVAVVGEDAILPANITDKAVTKSKLSSLEAVSNYENIPNSMKEESDNCYYHSSSYEVTSHNQYKIINISANSDDMYFYLNNLYRIYDFLGSPTEKNMVNYVGGGDNAGEQFYVLKKGHTLGITISKSKEANAVIKYAPYYIMSGLVIDSDSLLGKVKKENVDFIKNVNHNLFDGNYYDNYYLSRNDVDDLYSFTSAEGSKSIVVEIEPNTEYTILKEGTAIENGYYYFKVATFTIDKDTLLNQKTYTVDGSVRYTKTNASTSQYTFTTGENDKTLMIVVSKTYEPYLEILKGNQTTFESNSYEPRYEFDGIEVYSKTEIDSMLGNKDAFKNTFKKVGNVINICLGGKVGYRLEKNTKSSINLDTWMLTEGTVNKTVLWSGSDIEAPIKEVGAEDFIGGVHGDEKFETVQIICDGILLNLSNDYSLSFSNLTVFVKSTLFRCNTSTPVFTRYKKLEFVDNELIISNRLICLVDNFLVNRHTGCGLYSIYKDLLVGYTVNTKPELITSGATNKDANLDCGTFYGNGFTATLKTLSGKTEYYYGAVADFSSEARPRYKLYFDCINSTSGVQLNANDELNTSFSIKIV